MPVADDIEARLRDLGAHLDFPPAPPLAAMVRARIAGAEPPRPGAARWQPRRALAALALVAALVAALVLGIPPVRTTVAHWLGIGGVEIVPVQTLPPTVARTPRPRGSAVPGEDLDLGSAVTVQEAQRRAGFAPLVPGVLGPPDATWLRDTAGGMVSLVYLPRPGLPEAHETGVGLLVTELRAGVETPLLRKFVGPDTPVLPVSVDGGSGYWIAGTAQAPSEIAYVLPDGRVLDDSLRLAAPTLLFQRGPLTVRIEGQLSETEALRIAESLP